MEVIILILAMIGFLLSVYAVYVEKKLEKNKNYKAVCDVSSKVSCTKAFSSKYGKVFGMPNSWGGLGFYPAVIILTFFNLINIVFYLSILSMIFSLYLMYISFFKLKNYCVVCNGIYVVNILLLIFSYFNLIGQ